MDGMEDEGDSAVAVGQVNGTDNGTKANCSNEYCVSDEQYLDMIRDYHAP